MLGEGGREGIYSVGLHQEAQSSASLICRWGRWEESQCHREEEAGSEQSPHPALTNGYVRSGSETRDVVTAGRNKAVSIVIQLILLERGAGQL